MFTSLHVSRVTWHMSQVTCQIFFLQTKWWSLLVEGQLSTGPTLSSFNDRSAHQSHTCTPVGTMPPQTTPCTSFKDLNFLVHSNRVYYSQSSSVFICQMALAGRQKQIILKQITIWGESITDVCCSGENIGMALRGHQKEMKIFSNCQT